MKTKLNKISIAAALAAIVLSSGAFLSISLSLSQNADASCEVFRKGKLVFKCDGENGICSDSTKLFSTGIRCSGEYVAIDEKDDDIRLN